MRNTASEYLHPSTLLDSPSSGPIFCPAADLQLLPSRLNAAPGGGRQVLHGRRVPAKFRPVFSRIPETREPTQPVSHRPECDVLPAGKVCAVAHLYPGN